MRDLGTTRALTGLGMLLVVGWVATACAPAGPGSPAPEAGGDAFVDASRSAASRVESADTSDWRGQEPRRAEELLAGRFSGVEVIPMVGGGMAVRIRGQTSLLGNNDPLYVIDGMAVDAPPGQGLAGINPADIAKIEVLKDPGSTSMYGIRGANGVVVITTKRAR